TTLNARWSKRRRGIKSFGLGFDDDSAGRGRLLAWPKAGDEADGRVVRGKIDLWVAAAGAAGRVVACWVKYQDDIPNRLQAVINYCEVHRHRTGYRIVRLAVEGAASSKHET